MKIKDLADHLADAGRAERSILPGRASTFAGREGR